MALIENTFYSCEWAKLGGYSAGLSNARIIASPLHNNSAEGNGQSIRTSQRDKTLETFLMSDWVCARVRVRLCFTNACEFLWEKSERQWVTKGLYLCVQIIFTCMLPPLACICLSQANYLDFPICMLTYICIYMRMYVCIYVWYVGFSH